MFAIRMSIKHCLGALAGIATGLDNYAKGFDEVSQHLMQARIGDATSANEAMAPMKGDIRAMDEQLQALTQLIDTASDEERAAAASLLTRQTTLQLVALLAIGLVLSVAAWRVVSSVTRPPAPLQAEGRDEIGYMVQRLGQMQDSLRSLVRVIQENSASVDMASEQIAHGNQDLSARTERQAASLTQAAREGAARGGNVVAKVVETMTGIQGSSRRIADITGVIDGIAFQTNILALNAAVEAARAGEQGRGFAVVASEMRVLAQKSAAAAKEVKSLIGESVECVESGHGLVQQAWPVIDPVVEQVVQVDALVGQLSLAAQEQQQGIVQVGAAVGNLEQATQQNAALVEESAAAAESLRQQAEPLRVAASAFRLEAAVH